MKEFLSKIWGVIAKIFASLNTKYDKMEDSKQLYTSLGIGFVPWIVLDIFAIITNHKGFDIIAILWITFLIVIRIWWVEGNLKDYSNG